MCFFVDVVTRRKGGGLPFFFFSLCWWSQKWRVVRRHDARGGADVSDSNFPADFTAVCTTTTRQAHIFNIISDMSGAVDDDGWEKFKYRGVYVCVAATKNEGEEGGHKALFPFMLIDTLSWCLRYIARSHLSPLLTTRRDCCEDSSLSPSTHTHKK
jgi:hypothetical protein